MKLDPTTRQAFPGRDIKALFPDFDMPVSASFNGPHRDSQPYRIHVNPNESVALTQNKQKLFEKLASEALPVPKFYATEEMLDNDCLCIDYMQGAFGDDSTWGEFPLHVRDNQCEKMITDIDDAFLAIAMLQNPKTVIFQPAIQTPRIAQVSAIPGMAGRDMRNNAEISRNGILSGEVYSVIKKEIFQAACLIIETIGLDYGTVVIGYSETSFEIYDVHSRLQPAHISGLSHFIQLMINAEKNNTKKHR